MSNLHKPARGKKGVPACAAAEAAVKPRLHKSCYRVSMPLLVDNIGALATCDGAGIGLRKDAALLIQEGRITDIGARGMLPAPASCPVLDARGAAVVPGLVDCHTHVVFCGDRSDEFARRARGESYQQIAVAGGGIRATMRAVREATVDELVAATLPRLRAQLARGVTTVEVKSGYGLSVESELKMLDAIAMLQQRQPLTLVPTLLAAHAVPPEHEGAPSAWIDEILRELLPRVAREGLAKSVDVFVEAGAFSVDDGRRLLRRAQELGLFARVHAEQLSRSGGAALAAEVGAVAAGHLEYVTQADADALAEAGVVCEVLSLAQVFLRGQRPIPGAMLAKAGCTIAVASDANPGTAMSVDLPLAAGLSVTQSGLTAEQALLGITAGAARALGLADRGRIVPGARADLVVLQTSSPFDLVYRWSEPLAQTVIIGGDIAFST